MESPALQQQGADAPSITSSRKAFCDFAVTALFIGVTASFVEVRGRWGEPIAAAPQRVAQNKTKTVAADLPRPACKRCACLCRPPRLATAYNPASLQLSKHVSPSLGLSPGGAGLALTLLLLVVLVPVCEQLGGALFNPANNAFLYATGQGSGQEHILRSVRGHTLPHAAAVRTAACIVASWELPRTSGHSVLVCNCGAGGASSWWRGGSAAGHSAAASELDQVRSWRQAAISQTLHVQHPACAPACGHQPCRQATRASTWPVAGWPAACAAGS